MRRTVFAVLLASVAGLLVLTGCGSSRPASDLGPQASRALGTWEYRVNGFPVLDRGTIRLKRENGRLVAILRDRRQGRLRARASIQKTWMELRLDRIYISGRLHEGEYRARVSFSTWDVSSSQSFRRSSLQARGSLIAAQTQASTVSVSTRSFGCPPLLREGSYACSPLHPEEIGQ